MLCGSPYSEDSTLLGVLESGKQGYTEWHSLSVVPTKGNTVPCASNDLTVSDHRSEIGSGSAISWHIPVVSVFGAFGRGFSPSLTLCHT